MKPFELPLQVACLTAAGQGRAAPHSQQQTKRHAPAALPMRRADIGGSISFTTGKKAIWHLQRGRQI
jgi:hypothetical protein